MPPRAKRPRLSPPAHATSSGESRLVRVAKTKTQQLDYADENDSRDPIQWVGDHNGHDIDAGDGDGDTNGQQESASHLLSFLNDYDSQPPLQRDRHGRFDEDETIGRRGIDGGGSSDDDDRDVQFDEQYEEDDDEMEDDDDNDDEEGAEDPDEEGEGASTSTPTKRAKSGLVGTPGRLGHTHTHTPSKRRTNLNASTTTPASTSTPRRRERKGTDTPSGTPRPRGGAGTSARKRTKTGLVAAFEEAVEQGIIRPSRADAYFLAHSRSSRTSGHSYSAMAPQLSRTDYEAYTSKARREFVTVLAGDTDNPELAGTEAETMRNPSTHGIPPVGTTVKVVEALEKESLKRYDQWSAELDSGFNLLFYGFGSKRRAINSFVTDRLCHKGTCVVVNGHYPGLTIREVLLQIEEVLGIPSDLPSLLSSSSDSTVQELETECRSSSRTQTETRTQTRKSLEQGLPAGPTTASLSPVDRLAHRIYTHLLPPLAFPPAQRHFLAKQPLYLVLHNIDAPPLRSPRSMAVLSLLACSPRIHLIATFDHLHAPLLFSQSSLNTPKHTYPIYRATPSMPKANGNGQVNGNGDGNDSSDNDLYGLSSTEDVVTPYTPPRLPPSRGFNFLYHNLTTYADYTLELHHQRLSASSSALSGANGGLGGSSGSSISEEAVAQILLSVPPNALRLLKLIINRQLANLPGGGGGGQADGPGGTSRSTQTQAQPQHQYESHAAPGFAPVYAVDSDILQTLAREKFIAREDERYNALLGEYRDHGVILEAGAIMDFGPGFGSGAGAGTGTASGMAGQVGTSGAGAGAAGGRWLWVPMGKLALERVLGSREMDGVEV